MRTRRLAAAVAGSALCMTALAAQQDVPAFFSMKVEEAQGYVTTTVHGGRFSWAGYEWRLKKLQGEARQAMITNVFAWAKAYTESPAFVTQYANQRKRLEPRAPVAREAADKVLARQKTDLDQRIAAEKRLLDAPPGRTVTPEQVEIARKAREGRLKDYETRRVRFDDPQAFAEMRNKLETQAATEKQEYESARAKWEEQYPPDHRTLVAKRLQAFLSETADVDFAAKLVPCAGNNSSRKLQCFANPAYEKKSPEWKLCYRAGKQSLVTARTFATDWLREIESK